MCASVLAAAPSGRDLSIFRSNIHIYAQVIDDAAGRTLVAASSKDATLAEAIAGKPKIERAKAVGQLIAERAKAAGIERWSLIAVGSSIMGAFRRWPKRRVRPD